MAKPGDPHSPPDGAPSGPNDDDLFRDDLPPASPQSQRPTWAAPVRPAPEPDPHAHDDLIGFTSPASLAGTGRRPVSNAPEQTPAVAFEPEPVVAPFPQPDPSIHSPTVAAPSKIDTRKEANATEPARDDALFLKPSPVPAWAVETPLGATPVTAPQADRHRLDGPRFGRADAVKPAAVAIDGATSLYTIYAMILFAVPTFGVAALIGLFMVWTKPKPEQPLARSHFEFQTRTLWIAAIAAVVGVVLIAVNLGVFVLFLMALWVIVRGAWGVMTLAAGKPVLKPNTWLI